MPFNCFLRPSTLVQIMVRVADETAYVLYRCLPACLSAGVVVLRGKCV